MLDVMFSERWVLIEEAFVRSFIKKHTVYYIVHNIKVTGNYVFFLIYGLMSLGYFLLTIGLGLLHRTGKHDSL